MMIKNFNKANARTLQEEALAALQAIAKRHGVSVNMAGGSVGALDFKARFSFRVTDAATVEENERARFSEFCHLFGLKAEHFGATFVSHQEPWTVVGIEPSRSKFPIRAKSQLSGKIMLFTSDVARLIELTTQLSQGGSAR
jgi:hypothetical protein